MQNEEISSSLFNSYNLSEPLMRALNSMKFTEPTVIQQKTIPLLIENECDIVALAETGSGKTGAFGIPLIEKVNPDIRDTQAVILCPTRELAMQVSEQIQKLSQYKKLTIATIYGGASYIPQENALRKGAQVVVATPGRLIDFIEQGKAKLNKVEVIVLDEADEMISLGFKEALEQILESLKEDSQRWMFSATMNKQVRQIADTYLSEPQQVLMSKSGELPQTIEQLYYPVKSSKRNEALIRILQATTDFYGIVFCQTKLEVDSVSESLTKQGLFVEAFHGDRTQKERERILKKFREKTITVLVSTDVAARGLDVKNLTHVINYSLPWDVESYIHRIGRTGRNGQKGVAISLVSGDQMRKVDFIKKKTNRDFARRDIPTAEEVLKKKLTATIERVFSLAPNANELRMKELIADIVREKELDLKSLSREELISRLITKEMSYWLRAERDDNEIAVDKDLAEFDGWNERKRSGRGGRGGGGGKPWRLRHREGGEGRGGDRDFNKKGGKKFFRKRKSRD